MKNYIITIAIAAILISCSSARVAVPTKFQEQATAMKVKGVNGFKINQTLKFGNFETSRVRRGWTFSGGSQYTKFNLNQEEMLLRVFNVGTEKKNSRERSKLQYTITDGKHHAEVYAQEKFSAKELVYNTNNRFLGSVSRTESYEYAYGAAIMLLMDGQKDPWSLVMTNKYDAANDTARRLFDRPYEETEGYATNGKETINIRPLMIRSVTTKSGKKTNVIGGPMLSGYELRIEDGVVGIIDILDNTVWFYNELDEATRLVLSAVSSAVLLKNIHDVGAGRG